jgi:hypothetical protein
MTLTRRPVYCEHEGSFDEHSGAIPYPEPVFSIPAVGTLNSGTAAILFNRSDLLAIQNLFFGQVLEQAIVECRAVEDDGRVASTSTVPVCVSRNVRAQE